MLAEILPHLRRLSKHGSSYRASCPVHGEDKDPALKIAEIDGKVLMHCHACGANGMDVMKKLDLPVKMLFSGEFTHDPDWMLKKSKEDDLLFCMIYEAAEARGETIRTKELRRYKLAKQRNKIREEKNL